MWSKSPCCRRDGRVSRRLPDLSGDQSPAGPAADGRYVPLPPRGMLRVQLMLHSESLERPATGGVVTGGRMNDMPAVTVEDILRLPRIPDPDPTVARDRPVVAISTAPSGFEGEGFPVRRAFAGVDLRALDPFVHMDQMG